MIYKKVTKDDIKIASQEYKEYIKIVADIETGLMQLEVSGTLMLKQNYLKSTVSKKTSGEEAMTSLQKESKQLLS